MARVLGYGRTHEAGKLQIGSSSPDRVRRRRHGRAGRPWCARAVRRGGRGRADEGGCRDSGGFWSLDASREAGRGGSGSGSYARATGDEEEAGPRAGRFDAVVGGMGIPRWEKESGDGDGTSPWKLGFALKLIYI